MIWELILTSVLLGAALAMDAFSVSVADGLAEPDMKRQKSILIATVFGVFQFGMPLIGWFCVTYFLKAFNKFSPAIPYIALALLCFIGGKMIIECIKGDDKEESENVAKKLTFGALLLQGVATSIDALSVGFAISDYNMLKAVIASLIIGVVTIALCLVALLLGRKIGSKLDKAEIFGGIILICIGLEIFIKGVFF